MATRVDRPPRLLVDSALYQPTPIVNMTLPYENTHNVDLAMRKYVALQSQHDELVQHLDQIRQPSRSSTWSSAMSARSYGSVSPSSSTASLSSSPITTPTSSSAFTYPPQRRCRTTGWAAPSAGSGSTSSLDTVWDEDVLCEVECDEQRLSGINEAIKRTLTELLNCQVVRGDRSLRMWVQCRLMETEKELRSGRRKRSSY